MQIILLLVQYSSKILEKDHLHHNGYLSEFPIWNGHLQSVSKDFRLGTAAQPLQSSPRWSLAGAN